MQSLIELVDVVEAIEELEKARQLIPPELMGVVTFFSENDRWMYHSSHNLNVCVSCEELDGAQFGGDQIRGIFPYLMILDEDSIKVNIHPNCNCLLIRMNEEE